MAKRAPAVPDPQAMAQNGAREGARPLPSDDEDIRSAEAIRPALSWPWLTLSGLAHALVIAALLGLWRTTPLPEDAVVKVMLLADGRGAAGSAGGAGGGGGSASTAETASAAPAESAPLDMAPAEPAPPEAATQDAKPEPEPTAAQTPPAPVETAAAPAEPPPPPKPRPHHAKSKPMPLHPAPAPPPPTPAPAEAAKEALAPPAKETQMAAAPLPEPVPGAPGTGGETGGSAGAGRGAEGAGHGAIGGGPVTGPGDDYLDRLRRWLSKYKQYPKAAQQQKQEGGLVVSFTIARDGTVLRPSIERSSGFPLLDQAALKMLHDASPVPPLPPSYRADRAEIALPVDFTIGFFDRLF